MRRNWIGVLLAVPLLAAGWLLAACASPTPLPPTPTAAPTPIPTSPAPTVDPFFVSQGSGELRSAGYWLLWNSCAEGNQAEVARANGGREAGSASSAWRTDARGRSGMKKGG